MSKALYIGFDKVLSKTEYGKDEIFKDFGYADSLYASDGILFDKLADEAIKSYVGKSRGYVWYEVESVVMAFECDSRTADCMPDLYNAYLRMTEWFINFLDGQIKGGNMPHLMQIWLGDKDKKKTERKTLKLKDLRCENFTLPFSCKIKERHIC